MTGSGNNFKSCRGTEVTRFNPCRQNFKQTKRFTASYFLVSTWKDLLFDVSVIDVIERNYEIWARVEGKLIRMTMDNRRSEDCKLGPQLRITNIGDLKLCFNIIFWLRYFLLRVKVLYRLVKIKREKKYIYLCMSSHYFISGHTRLQTHCPPRALFDQQFSTDQREGFKSY